MSANFSAAVAAWTDSDLEGVFLEPADRRTHTRADLARESARFAGMMVKAGAVRGDRIAVQVDKSPASLFLYLGCLRAGLVYLPLNIAYQRGELPYFLQDAHPRIVASTPHSSALIREISPLHPHASPPSDPHRPPPPPPPAASPR